MVNIERVRVGLAGFAGGPGVSTFYCLDAAAMTDALGDYYNNFSNYWPSVVHWTVETSGDVIDPLTGHLAGDWADGVAGDNVGNYTGDYAGGVGAVVNWATGSVLNNHRVKGKTYMVPLAGNVFDSDGTLDPTARTGMKSAADALITATTGNFVVWSRPTSAHAGGYVAVTLASVPDKSAILRSRRD